MKRIAILILATLMLGCSSNDTPESLRNQLAKLKQKQLDLNHQINEIERKLNEAEGEEVISGLVPVLVKTIAEEQFSHFLMVNGKVELLEEAQVSPEANGQITKIYVVKGQTVKKGDLLVTLNTSMVRNSIEEVKVGLELTTKIYEKQKSLWDQNIGSELQYLEAKNAKESLERRLKTLQSQLEMSIVRAPFSGIVDEIFQKEGELASPGRAILYLINLDKLKVFADASEALLPKIDKGDMVSIHFPTYNMDIEAPINRIGNTIDDKTRTVKIEILIDNVKGKIKPNQMAALRIKDFEEPKALVVPSIVVKQDSRGEFLFIVEKNERGEAIAKKLYVESGLSYNDQTMIIKGLELNQMVITAGFNQVGNGSLVEIR
jgi:membrane fusion protein, multidrug efflux system